MTLTLQIIWLIGAIIFFILSILEHENRLEYTYAVTLLTDIGKSIIWPISICVLLWELWKEWRG